MYVALLSFRKDTPRKCIVLIINSPPKLVTTPLVREKMVMFSYWSVPVSFRFASLLLRFPVSGSCFSSGSVKVALQVGLILLVPVSSGKFHHAVPLYMRKHIHRWKHRLVFVSESTRSLYFRVYRVASMTRVFLRAVWFWVLEIQAAARGWAGYPPRAGGGGGGSLLLFLDSSSLDGGSEVACMQEVTRCFVARPLQPVR